jgi:pyruvate dehydrogenase E2 component (dihydrolipoamide acetyltransferase)
MNRQTDPRTLNEGTPMATEFLMPKLGLTMEEGTITKWLVDDGTTVEAGAAILRIETDKTETDVEAPAAGRIRQLGAIGETFACGEMVGWFLADGEDTPAASPSTPTESAPAASAADTMLQGADPLTPGVRGTTTVGGPTTVGSRVLASPNARRIAAERGLDLRAVNGTGPRGRIVSEDLDGIGPASPGRTREDVAPDARNILTDSALAKSAPGERPGGVPATAAARQLADLLGVDVSTVAPDPLDRRVTRESVALHVRSLLHRAAAEPAAATALPPATQVPSAVIPLAGMRGTIAKRMHASLTSMAQLTLTMDAELDAVVADREARKSAATAPSYTDYVIAAVARALREHPLVNSQITDDGVALLPTAHVGMAVALDDGLIVPVVHDTASRDLSSLATESKRLAEAARAGSLGLADLDGGTISVTTLGMFGVDGFTPVINPPNTAILGVGRLRDDVVLGIDGAAGSSKRITLSLTWDHRAFDGAPAAAFCRSVAELLASPDALDATGATSAGNTR